jgi:hypothetical protein
MHIQHIESTSGHTGNISGPPHPFLHNTKLTFDTLLWIYGAETHTDTHDHILLNILLNIIYTNKTDIRSIAKILLKVAVNIITPSITPIPHPVL